jgi:hypothetical protein
MPRRLIVLLAAAALAVSACGTTTSSSTVKFNGAAKDVADVVSKMATDGRSGDGKSICSDTFAQSLVNKLNSGGRTCEDEMKDAVRDASDYDLQVRSVKVDGNNATAVVRQGDDGPTATFTFVKEGGNWRASSLG